MMLWLVLAIAAPLLAQTREMKLLADPSQLEQPAALPMANGETATVFRGEPGVSGFNLHSYIAHFGGRFWAVWSSSRNQEEAPDQLIRYATSADGLHWSAPAILAADPDGPEGPARWIARGLWVENGRLVALGAYIESANYREQGKGEVWHGLKLMRFEWVGERWESRGVFADDCMNNFPPVRLGFAHAMACRDSFMRVSMALADSAAPGGWRRTPLAAAPPFDRMDEPSFYEGPDGTVHLIVRDNRKSGRLIHSVSRDGGRNWSAPVLSNYPDATSKNFTGRLADGRCFLINNPDRARRDPLAISFSRDGWIFANPLALRKGTPGIRTTIQYPHAIEHGGSLWVIYSVNKSEIAVTRVQL